MKIKCYKIKRINNKRNEILNIPDTVNAENYNIATAKSKPRLKIMKEKWIERIEKKRGRGFFLRKNKKIIEWKIVQEILDCIIANQ